MTDDNGMTPLHHACQNGRHEAAVVLLHYPKSPKSRPASFDLVDYRGRTALHYAAEGGSLAIVRELLYMGADAHVLDNEYKTPHLLCSKRNQSTYQQLRMASQIDSVARRSRDIKDWQDVGKEPFSDTWKRYRARLEEEQAHERRFQAAQVEKTKKQEELKARMKAEFEALKKQREERKLKKRNKKKRWKKQ